MILIPGVKKKNIGVYGLGVSGIATCEALAASGAAVFSFDEKASAREKTANTEYRCEHPKKWPWKDMAAVVVSPGVPLTHPKPHAIVRKAAMEKIPVVGDTELFAWAVNALPEEERPQIVGITGTNGKSTTTALIGHILKEAGREVHIGGNIGEAVLSMPPLEKDGVYVLELSSFQLDLTHTLRLNAAVFLNVTPDHIDRHGGIDGYVRAKKRIFLNQTADDIAVIGVDDDFTQGICTEITASGPATAVPVSVQGALGRGVYELDNKLFYNFDGKTSFAGELSAARALRGAHNHQNLAAALAVCAHLGLSPAVVIKTAERFSGLPHRMEEVSRIGKVSFVNDSKATNADAAARALSVGEDIFWIAGGKAKEGGVMALREKIDHVRSVYLIGEAAVLFEEQLRGAAHCILCGDLATAVAKAGEDAAKSDAAAPMVLFSPACASFDQFPNFEIRGEAFRTLVANLPAENGEAA